MVSKFLTSSLFKNPSKSLDSEQIDVQMLLLLGILHCKGSPEIKAYHFLRLAVDEVKDEQDPIAAATLKSIFEKLFSLASHRLYVTLEDIGVTENLYCVIFLRDIKCTITHLHREFITSLTVEDLESDKSFNDCFSKKEHSWMFDARKKRAKLHI